VSAVTLAAALEAVRLGEATQAHAAVLASAIDVWDRAIWNKHRAELDAALAEQRRAVARLAEVSAERDRLLAVVVAQSDAADAQGGLFVSNERFYAWCKAVQATEALARELRGSR
jgi:hypothetical protein